MKTKKMRSDWQGAADEIDVRAQMLFEDVVGGGLIIGMVVASFGVGLIVNTVTDSPIADTIATTGTLMLLQPALFNILERLFKEPGERPSRSEKRTRKDSADTPYGPR